MIYDLRADAEDFFDAMMPEIFPGIDFSQLSKTLKKPYRLKEKRVVYGMSYGRGAWAISMQLTQDDPDNPTSTREAQTIIDNYLARYPLLAEWRENILPRVKTGDLISPFGRRFQQDYVPKNAEQNIENAALAFLPQSTASDICLDAAMAIQKRLKAEGFVARISATVHDAIYAPAPKHEAEAVKAIMLEEMPKAALPYFQRVPFLVEAKIGDHWNLV